MKLDQTRARADADADVRKLLHELQVHQIELETQNGELRETQQQLAAARDSYAALCAEQQQLIALASAAERNSNELLQQNRALTRRMFALQEAERRHLARELHDELGQWLTAIQAEAHAICSSTAATQSAELRASAEAIGQDAAQVHELIRNMLRRLRPNLLDQLGLADSIRELVAQWRRANPQVAVELALDDAIGKLDGLLGITLYRIAQEGLSNIASHAQASRVALRLYLEAGTAKTEDIADIANIADSLTLTLTDNGKGLQQPAHGNGLGLLGMRERVAALGGSFILTTAAGGGLQLTARLPLALALAHGEEHAPAS